MAELLFRKVVDTRKGESPESIRCEGKRNKRVTLVFAGEAA
jgi:hypothetical protein